MEKKLVLITGMSGAGKSSAMNALEDLGYTCIDNFPIELLPQLEELINGDNPRYDRLALAVSATDYLDVMNFFDALKREIQIIFVDASDQELLLRYRFTRRQHPMISMRQASTLEDAIELERDLFNNLQKSRGDMIHIDTTKLTVQSLANHVRSYFSGENNQEFAVTFQSFGFKHGLPMDADEVIDVRFLPNPFYEPALKNKTGNDQEVYDYVLMHEETQEFLQSLKAYLEIVLKSYAGQQKNHLMVDVGCTGGQHRSVSIANWLYDQFKDQYRCFKIHRDIQDDKGE